jgi:MFS family permease
MSNPQQPATSFIGKFTVLFGAERELWLTFVVKLLSYAAYAVTNLTLKLWLSSEFHYTDQQALGIVTAWAVSMTIVTLLVGALTDAIGLRRAFFLGVWLCIAARTVMIFCTVPWAALAFGLFPLAAGEALGTPVLVAAVRKFSTTPQRSISFSVAYMIMNIGSLGASYIFDWVRQGLGEHGHLSLFGTSASITTYRTLFLVSLCIELTLLPLIWWMRPNIEITDDGVKFIPRPPKVPAASLLHTFARSVRDSGRETIRIFGELSKEQGFYRLIMFLLLIAFLKLIMMQMYYVFPAFGIRELGEGAPVGKLWAINAWIVIPAVPIIGALTQRFPAYLIVTIGGIISAGSVFIMAMPPAWFQSLADTAGTQWVAHHYLGLTGPVNPYYVTIGLFVIALSFGEAFYSPRVYEYASAIAPKGQEASYGALSYVPFLIAKLLVGTVSAALLAKYCPEVGERHSGMMWLFVALMASVAPVGLIALRRFVRVKEAGRTN